MSSMLLEAGITQCRNFYSIRDDQAPTEIAADKDFFIGQKKDVTVTISNGETLKVRDIVVLGKLSIKPSNLENTDTIGKLVARDIFIPGYFSTENVELECRNIYQPENVQQFKQELEDIITNWSKFQKDN